MPWRNEKCHRVYPHQSIQDAVNRASPGDRIEVEAGTYNEQLVIKKPDIHLIGKGATLQPPPSPTQNLCTGLSQTGDGHNTSAGICIHGHHIELEAYHTEHRKILSVGTFLSKVQITGFTVSNFDGENIAAIGTQSLHISHNTLVDGGQYGFLSVGCKGTRAEHNTVSTDKLDIIGLLVDDYADAVLAGNDVTGYFTALVSQTNGGVIKDNRAYNVCVGASADPGVKGSVIRENDFEYRNPGCDKGFAAYGAGVVVFGASETLVEENTVERFNNGGFGVGIFLLNGSEGEVATGNVVKGNVLRENYVDVFDSSTGENVFGGNKCESVSNSTVKSFPAEACA
ncbi:pectin lyase-like protein [Polyplosphaeria fusca]|uniref:Pectin lyase-like protein n=1 Tax=Polyplosphaeria fusca TaxID=682080 RepID=A0A9P4QMY4_9PLEO|nr:pectin lyase-like protein [Polyplosphaeria fusca]